MTRATASPKRATPSSACPFSWTRRRSSLCRRERGRPSPAPASRAPEPPLDAGWLICDAVPRDPTNRRARRQAAWDHRAQCPALAWGYTAHLCAIIGWGGPQLAEVQPLCGTRDFHSWASTTALRLGTGQSVHVPLWKFMDSTVRAWPNMRVCLSLTVASTAAPDIQASRSGQARSRKGGRASLFLPPSDSWRRS